MTERDKILGRIREALTVLAPEPGSHGTDLPQRPHAPVDVHHASDWLPQVGESFEERLELFRSNSLELRTDFHFASNLEDAIQLLQEIAKADGWQKIATHAGALTDQICPRLSLPSMQTSAPYDVHELEACDAGITECDALVAQTGSIIVSTQSAGGRALSVLPPHHVVLARREQLLADLPAAFAMIKQRYGSAYPSFMSFITGPSRTGDIERILVLGAHGPKKLSVICF